MLFRSGHDHEEAERSSYAMPDQTVSTDAYIGQLDDYTIEYSGGPESNLDSEESD